MGLKLLLKNLEAVLFAVTGSMKFYTNV